MLNFIMSSVDFKFFISYQAIVIQRKNKEFQMRQKDLYLAMKGLIRLSKPKKKQFQTYLIIENTLAYQ